MEWGWKQFVQGRMGIATGFSGNGWGWGWIIVPAQLSTMKPTHSLPRTPNLKCRSLQLIEVCSLTRRSKEEELTCRTTRRLWLPATRSATVTSPSISTAKSLVYSWPSSASAELRDRNNNSVDVARIISGRLTAALWKHKHQTYDTIRHRKTDMQTASLI